MFKRLLVLALILGIGLSANAALKISVDGVVDEPDTSITLMLDIWGDGLTPGPQDALLIAEGPGTINGGVMIYPGFGSIILPESPEEFELMKAWLESIGGFSNVNSISCMIFDDFLIPPAPLNGTLVDGIIFHCEGPGDVVLSLISVDEVGAVTVFDTQVVHQIPEPVTIALLGLGGLLLRRRMA